MPNAAEKTQNSSGNARARLLREAAKLFMEHGYERTTMRNIANATEIKLGSIAYYFKSKDEILYEAIRSTIESGEERALLAVKQANTAKERLRALISIELESFINETGAITIKEWRCLQKKQKVALLKHRKTYEDLWMATLAECQDQGLIRAKPEIARRVLHGAFAWAETWYSTKGELSLRELDDEIMKLITQAESD